MRLKYMIAIAIFVMGTSPVFGQTRRGLHVTTEELNIWNQRRVSGPYKTEWDTAKSRADAAVATPESRWTARDTGGCWNPFNASEISPGRTRDRNTRDAGLFWLLTNSTSYRDAVLTALLAQVAVSNTNVVTNADVWCSNIEWVSKGFEVTNWIRRLLYAYDYIRPSISSGDRATIDAWFLNWGNYIELTTDNWIDNRFPNRYSDNYTCSGLCPGSNHGLTHFGGYMSQSFHDGWSNQPATAAATWGAIGIVIGDVQLQDRAKRFYREWLKYGVFPGGIPKDQIRWTDSGATPQTGYLYLTTVVGSIVLLADEFARNGDTSLYEYSTEEGLFGTASPGNPKTLLQVLLHVAGLTNGTKIQYASTVATTNPDLRIDCCGLTLRYRYFVNLAPANVYFGNAAVKTAYMTSQAGSWNSSGYDELGGEWGNLSTVLGMYGQMEGLVQPYPGSGPPPDPPPPPPANPIGYWKFDENTGTVAKDSSTVGNTGTLTNGATWTTGKSGSAVSFDGVNDFVKIATTGFSLTEGTFAAWVKAPSFKSTPQYIFGHTLQPPYASTIQLYTDEIGGNLDLGFGDNHSRALNIQQLSINTWYHIALTWSFGTYRVYVNGVQKVTGTYVGLTAFHTYAHIGGNGNDANPQTWTGVIDEAKIWARALTPTEVLADFNAIPTGPLAAPANLTAK